MKTFTVAKHLNGRVIPSTISAIRLNHTELKRELSQKIPSERSRITKIRRRQVKEHVVEPKHGMLGLNDLIWETSEQNDEHELVFRGYTIPQILNELPKLPGSTIPAAEGHFWLLLTGRIPSIENVKALMKDWDSRAIVPFFVEKLIRDMPPTTPPVEQLSSALNILQSKFVESYTTSGIFKEKYWEMVLEDCMDLIAKVPTIAALIYNKLYRHKMFLPMRNPHTDWASNFALQLGVNNKVFADLMRLFMIVYSDLHGKNFSGVTCLSGSALSDPYKSYANGLNQLASHKSGFYAHDHIEFLKRIHDDVGTNPTKALILEYLHSKNYKDNEIPGYANLNFKEADPRYVCMLNFAKEHFADDPLLNLTELVSEAITEINSSVPNVDAISGLLFYLFGIREDKFFPVMFGISRSLGLLSSYVWDRALGVPLDKKSESTDTKLYTKIPERGTCADFVKSHGIAKSKLMQGIDIFPIITSSVTNLNVSLRATQSVKSAHQKNTTDLSTTLPTQQSTLSSSGVIGSGVTIPVSQSQQSSNEMLPSAQSQLNSSAMVSVLQPQLNSSTLVTVSQSSERGSISQPQLNSSRLMPVSQSNEKKSVSQPKLTSSAKIPVTQSSGSMAVSQSHLNSIARDSVLQPQPNTNVMVPTLHPDMQPDPNLMVSTSQSQPTSSANCLTSQPQLSETGSVSQSQSNSGETVTQFQLSASATVPISQTEVSLNSMVPMCQPQINSSGQPPMFQSSTANLQSSSKPQSHSSEECVSGDDSGAQKKTNDSFIKHSQTFKENNKSRHLMLSKPPSPVSTMIAYSNKNSGTNSLKTLKHSNQFPNKHSGYRNPQLVKKMHQKNDKTKITSFIKEKGSSRNVKNPKNFDLWKCNY